MRVLGEVLGGPEEDRTPDLRIANATLSQLSYRPMILHDGMTHLGWWAVVGSNH
jgi:hypothetical protein